MSLSLDWFDARGVIPAAALEAVALLRPLPSSGAVATVARDPSNTSANVAAAQLVMLAIALLWLEYVPSPDQTL